MKKLVIVLGMAAVGWVGAYGQAPVERDGGVIDLPTSKQIDGVVPGGPQRLNSGAISMAVSPDGRWVVTLNDGYGSFESGYRQSLAVLDTKTGKVVDFSDKRFLPTAKQTLFSGLAFSSDGKHVYTSVASLSDPEGTKEGDTGSGIAVYSFAEGKLAPESVLKIPMQRLAAGRKTALGSNPDKGLGVPYPAAIAVVSRFAGIANPGGELRSEQLLVADNLSDDVLLMGATSGRIAARFDLSESDVVPGTYPIALAVSKDGLTGYVALWNSSEVVELNLAANAAANAVGVVKRRLTLLKGASATAPGSHPVALQLSPDGRSLYVALSNRDAVAAVDLSDGKFALKGYFDARLPGQSFYGAQPESLAVSADGHFVYSANMGSDAVAVMDTRKLTKKAVERGMVEPDGFVPTEWLPMALVSTGGKVYVASAKGTGTGPNVTPQQATSEMNGRGFLRTFTYIPTLLHGSIAVLDEAAITTGLKGFTARALEDNRMRASAEKIVFSGLAAGAGPTHPDGAGLNGAQTVAKTASPIKHVIYIIRENRTYDQILGDLEVNGKRVGNGDPALTMYGKSITPNMHKLVTQFGVLDNFYDSAEVSGDGHVWSNAAIGTDYLERTWQIDYRGRERGYDYEGVVSEGIPLNQGIPDVNEPGSGYIWGNLAKQGKTLYHFGEFISSVFCTDKGASSKQDDPTQGPMHEGRACDGRKEVKLGERLPDVWGGEVSKWPWAIPLLASNTATKPELVGHFAPESPDFNIQVPDQIRVDIFLKHLDGWIADRKAGTDTMPNFVMLRLANDHTAATKVGGPTPKASIADNDLAVGRAVDAISHSAFWDDTAFFILEDDAQNGADHVDAHRSLGVIVSKYAPHTADGMPFVDSRFYSTVSMIRTMETLLGLPPMNNNDAFSSMMGSLFTGPGDQPAFNADPSNLDNGLMYTVNTPRTPGAKASAKLDFRHADRADARTVNIILWQDAMGSAPVPVMLTEKRKKAKKMTMTNQYNLGPLKLKPVFAERVWGKTSLKPWYEDTGTTEKVGEAWLTGPDCIVVGGEQDGRTLRDVSAQCVGTLSKADDDNEFPLLVKMLFPDDKLSVQVHPDDDEAVALGLKRGKTECWYVLEAVPGATVACGLRDGVTVESMRIAIADGTLESLMEIIPVAVGDMVFVDAGTVHAIGAGVVLLEVQQTCDITYRLFDYGRPRELHLEQGMAVVKTRTKAGQRVAENGEGYTRLIDEKYFVIDRFEVPPGMTFEMPMDGVGCVVCLQGKAAVNEVRFGLGEAVVITVGSVTMSSSEGAVFLRIWEPLQAERKFFPI